MRFKFRFRSQVWVGVWGFAVSGRLRPASPLLEFRMGWRIFIPENPKINKGFRV